ncbi:hypothetical protein CLOP_g15911 [Closterium sp. NIES-67]|nr:hypothetical protein CLOP_g15911 [Closterium sp. NIES-67]
MATSALSLSASRLFLLLLLSSAICAASAVRVSPLNNLLRPAGGFFSHRRPRPGKPAPYGARRNPPSVPSQLANVLPHAAQSAADAMSA